MGIILMELIRAKGDGRSKQVRRRERVMEFGGSGKEFIVLKVYAILSNSIYSHPSNAFQKQKQKKKQNIN